MSFKRTARSEASRNQVKIRKALEVFPVTLNPTVHWTLVLATRNHENNGNFSLGHSFEKELVIFFLLLGDSRCPYNMNQ